ncbi:MAG: alpha-L-fucosidase, partial [Verrucomicrobia bacterium]|nr:alpha-L-fucosidase [Verrucomicrobiota bacterium]
LGTVATILALSYTASGAVPDPFHETAVEYNARAQWFRDAKFGVFIHWNPSSLVGQEISWCRDKVGREKYDQLYKEFKGEKFNATEWIQLFHEAGIRYAVFVPKHHDGFCMFDTKTSDYNVMHSPFGRDYIKEMSDACGKSDVRFCLYYSVLDFWNPKYSAKAGADLTGYKNDVFKPHLRELLTHYGPIGYIWFDGNWERSWTHADGREMYAFARKVQPGTLMGNRIEPNPTDKHGMEAAGSFYNAPDAVGDFAAREMRVGDYSTEKAWDSCLNISACGWAWVPPMTVRPLPEILNWLIQCIGRDGNMLLGVGPRPDGTIDPASAARLLEIGDWLKLNGEAVYGTRGGPYLPGDWGVSTRKGNKVFVFVTHWNGDTLRLPALPAKVTSSRLLTGGTGSFVPTGSTWTLRVPGVFRRPLVTIAELALDRDVMGLTALEVPEPKPVSKGKPVTVSGEWKGREKELSKAHVNDGDFNTIWAGPENSREGWVQIDLGEERTIAAVILDEGPYQRWEKFEVQAQIAGEWRTLAAGTTIGKRKCLSFEPAKARLFRLVIAQANEVPTLAEFQLFEKQEE